MISKLHTGDMERFLSRQVVGRIGCLDGKKVYVIPVSYAFVNNCIYVHSLEGLKLKIMRTNPQVCFQVDDTANLSNWKSVSCWGTFIEIEDEKEKAIALELLRSRVLPILKSELMNITEDWPFSSANDQPKGVLFKISISEMTGRFEHNGEEYFNAS